MIISLEDIFSAIKSYNPDADFDQISRAYNVAQEAHKNQFRASGEPYFLHPEAVALVVASELRLDSTSVCAALLHDVVEDTEINIENIEEMFGPVMAQLVGGVTKLNKVFFSSPSAAQAASFRKMLLATTNDIDNFDQTGRQALCCALLFAPEQKYITRNSEIYAPLAHRLGINKIKSELKKLSSILCEKRKRDK